MGEPRIIRFRFMRDDSPVWEGEFHALEDTGISVVLTHPVAVNVASYMDRNHIDRTSCITTVVTGYRYLFSGLPLTLAD